MKYERNEHSSKVASALVLSAMLMATPQAGYAGKPGSGGGGTTSSSNFSCRASPVRVAPLLGSIVEPIVANPAQKPCATDNNALLGINTLGVSASVLVADTEGSKAPASADSFVAGLGVLSLVNAGVLESSAEVKSVNGKCVLSGKSTVTSAVVNLSLLNVLKLDLITGPTDISIPLVGTLHFNKTLFPNSTTVVQRALWLEFDPLLGYLGLHDVVAGEAIAGYSSGKDCGTTDTADKRRMTGGGNFAEGSITVTHGYTLHCDKNRGPNKLEINWGSGNHFHLTSLASAACTDDPAINPGQPVANFDTYAGTGVGVLNNTDTLATAEWLFTDAGEPGTNDRAYVIIRDKDGNTVLDVAGTVFNGNHQAH